MGCAHMHRPVSSPIQEGKGPLTWQFAMKSASRFRRDAKQLGRGLGVKSLPPIELRYDVIRYDMI